jgi:hypothetical protein
LFTNISGSYTGPKPNHVSLDRNGLKSQAQLPPDSSLMVSVLALAEEELEPELELELELELLLLQTAAISTAAASAAVKAVHLEVGCLM